MKLHLIRHGESHINVLALSDLPTMDTELTEKGHRQALALRNWLTKQGRQGDTLYSSSLLRTRETSAYVAVALKLPIIIDDRLREIGSSYATSIPIEEAILPRTFNSLWADKAPFAPVSSEFEGIESWMHLRVRLAQFADQLTMLLIGLVPQLHPMPILHPLFLMQNLLTL